jgi:hypothetical protein
MIYTFHESTPPAPTERPLRNIGGFLEQAIDQMKVTFFFCHIFKLLGETGFTEQEMLAIC